MHNKKITHLKNNGHSDDGRDGHSNGNEPSPDLTLTNPLPPTLGAEKKRKKLCPVHNLVHRQEFSLTEALYFVQHRAELRLCESCFLFFRAMVDRAKSEARS
jgi:hypothetical protein